MKRILLIDWNAGEAKSKVAKIAAAGYDTRIIARFTPGILQELRSALPAAIVIDLSHLPAQGRDLGVLFRHTAATRHVPLVFLEGEPEKVTRIRQLLPDAVYSTWGKMRSSLKTAISQAPLKPIVPSSIFAGYSGTPLPKKLGIKPGFSVRLVNAPADFPKALGELPPGVSFFDKAQPSTNLTLCFLTSRAQLEREAPRMAGLAATQPVWLMWPKKASGIASDLTEKGVRETGLAAGMVDYKVCAVDAVWSGLLFRMRR